MNKPGASSLLSFFAAFSVNSLLAISVIKMPMHCVAYVKQVAGEGWKNAKGEPAGPLVTVNGKDVSGSGTFSTASHPPESVGMGTLKAHCGQLNVTNIQ